MLGPFAHFNKWSQDLCKENSYAMQGYFPTAAFHSSMQTFSSLDSLQRESMFHRRDDFAKSTYKRHGRAILTDEQARAIFQVKPSPFARDRDRAGALARAYGVSVKTVRDIWVGRTWYRATFDLDPTAPISPERLHKKPGRPKGAKDSKPRVKKPVKDEEGDSDDLVPSTPANPHLPKQEDATENNCWKSEPLAFPRSQLRFSIETEHDACCADAHSACAPAPGARDAPATAESRSLPEAEDLLPAWHAAPLAVIAPELLDPFHHDWAFWPADDSNDGDRQGGELSAASAMQQQQLLLPPPAPASLGAGREPEWGELHI